MKTLLFILGGLIVKNPDKTWRLARYTDIDERFGFVAEGYWRAVAGAYIWTHMRGVKVFVAGGKCGISDPETPFMSSVIKQELVQLGVSAQAIVEMKNADTTFLQLRSLSAIMREGERAIIVSNRYHIPRIEAMLKFVPELDTPAIRNVVLQPAEDVLLAYEYSLWQEDVYKAYASENMRLREALERKGILDLKSGQYEFRTNGSPRV